MSSRQEKFEAKRRKMNQVLNGEEEIEPEVPDYEYQEGEDFKDNIQRIHEQCMTDEDVNREAMNAFMGRVSWKMDVEELPEDEKKKAYEKKKQAQERKRERFEKTGGANALGITGSFIVNTIEEVGGGLYFYATSIMLAVAAFVGFFRIEKFSAAIMLILSGVVAVGLARFFGFWFCVFAKSLCDVILSDAPHYFVDIRSPHTMKKLYFSIANKVLAVAVRIPIVYFVGGFLYCLYAANTMEDKNPVEQFIYFFVFMLFHVFFSLAVTWIFYVGSWTLYLCLGNIAMGSQSGVQYRVRYLYDAGRVAIPLADAGNEEGMVRNHVIRSCMYRDCCGI